MATREQTSIAKIDNMITLVRTHVSSFNDTVQDASVAIMEHASIYGDCSRAKMLARAVPSRLRNMLIGYFRLYSPIGVSIGKTAADDKGRFVSDEALLRFRQSMRLEGAEGVVQDVTKWPKFHLVAARANKWYDDPARVAPEPKPLDGTKEVWDKLETFLERLLKDAQKDDEKARYAEEDRPIIVEMVTNLQRIIKREHVKMAEKLAVNENPQGEEEKGASPPIGGNVVAGPKPQRQARKASTGRKPRQAASVH